MPSRAYNRNQTGKLVPTGSWILDIRTKTVGRIRKATQLYPGQRAAREQLEELRLMIKELDRQRDVTRLSIIKAGKVALLDALIDYKHGRLAFIEAHVNDPFAELYSRWIEESSGSPATRRTKSGALQRLVSFGFISPETPVRDLPDIMRRFRVRYQTEGKAISFNQTRGSVISFFKQFLGYDEESPLLRRLLAVPLIKVTHRRPHHPLSSLSELQVLMGRINAPKLGNGRGGPATDYRPWILFLAMTGLRPTEFFGGLWKRDPMTGHLRVIGKKTRNAERVIPSVMYLKPEVRSPHGLHQRLEAIIPAIPTRIRDFRRTAAIWFEQAGIPRGRVSHYLGHGAREMTALYQLKTPNQDELDGDRELLLKWMEAQRNQTAVKRKRVWATTADALVNELLC